MNDHIAFAAPKTTADALRSAAAACQTLLASGDLAARDAALKAGRIAVEAMVADENWLDNLDDPTTRRSRFGYAAWLMLLAGTDAGATKADIEYAASLFTTAAES